MSLRTLKTKVARLANADGRIFTGYPGLWFFRSQAPTEAKTVSVKMVTLAVVLQGRKRVRFGDLELAYEPGSYLFVTGERRYQSQIEAASATKPYLSVALELAPEEIAEAVFGLSDAGVHFESSADDEQAIVARLKAPITNALTRLVSCLPDSVERSILAPLAKKELIVHLLRGPAGATLRQAAAADDGRIRRAIAFVNAHAAERITIERLAKHVAMSPSHFAHRFRDVVRMTPIQYLKHVRLQQARLLMLGGGRGAAEAAAEVGYASPSHFARDFKDYFGVPPGRYVQQFRGDGAIGA